MEAYCKKATLKEGARWVGEVFNIEIRHTALGDWLRTRRKGIPDIARKTRPDSKLGRLNAKQQAAMAKHCEKVSVPEGVLWIKKKFGIDVNEGSLGKWLRKRRVATIYAGRLDQLRDDDAFAELVVKAVGSVPGMTEAASVIIGQVALEEARKPEEERDLEKLMKLMKVLLPAWSKAIESRDIDFRVKRFKFNATEEVERLAEEIHAIRHGPGDEREKMEKIMLLLFGPEPDGFTDPADGKEEEEAESCS